MIECVYMDESVKLRKIHDFLFCLYFSSFVLNGNGWLIVADYLYMHVLPAFDKIIVLAYMHVPLMETFIMDSGFRGLKTASFKLLDYV